MRILSSTEKETASPCVPSRRVVSNVWMRIWSGRALLSYARFFRFFQEGHHFAKLRADLLELLSVLGFPHGEELPAAAGFVFRDPLFRKFARLNFRQNLLHLGAGSVVDH